MLLLQLTQAQGPERAGTSEEEVSLTCGFEERAGTSEEAVSLTCGFEEREAERARSPATLRSEK